MMKEEDRDVKGSRNIGIIIYAFSDNILTLRPCQKSRVFKISRCKKRNCHRTSIECPPHAIFGEFFDW